MRAPHFTFSPSEITVQRRIVAATLLTAVLTTAAIAASDLKHGLLTGIFVLIAIAATEQASNSDDAATGR